jgi:hypothetical protein
MTPALSGLVMLAWSAVLVGYAMFLASSTHRRS